MTQPVDRTPEEILKKLMADRDPVIRLRAVNAWLDHQSKQTRGCPACEARAEDERWLGRVIAALTDDERARLEALIEQHTALKEEIYARDPKLRPLSYTPPSRTQEPEPASPSVEAASVGNIIVDEDEDNNARPEPAPEQPPSPGLSEADYESVGLVRMDVYTRDGVVSRWTHPEGDHVMNEILSGQIPLDEARRLARLRQQRLARETAGLAARSSL